jgi:transposase-like protein
MHALKDFEFRSDRYGNCKHCHGLAYYLQLQVKVLEDVEEQIEQSIPEEITLCPDCNSLSVIHYGKRGKRIVKQIMFCKDCGRQFRKQEEVFAKLQNDPRTISLILSMHCRNVSLRGISATLNETYGIKVSYKTVFN